MSNPQDDFYLGDGAYVREEGNFVVIYTSNSAYRTNSVYLEPEVLHNLIEWLKRLKEVNA